MKMGCCGEHQKNCYCAEDMAFETALTESTRRDVQTAIELQERENWGCEEVLAARIEKALGWNSNHAREIAELAWTSLYAETVRED